jgi:hypothetical protein
MSDDARGGLAVADGGSDGSSARRRPRVRWDIVAAGATCAALLAVPMLDPMNLPWSLLLLFLVVPAAEVALTPLWRAAGVYRYHSPVLFGIARGANTYELHGGTLYDYLVWRNPGERGARTRRALLRGYIAGLLDVAGSVGSGTISSDTRIVASSYVFSERTAQRLGFTIERPSAMERVHLLLDAAALTAMYSFARGRPSLPRLWRVRRASIPADALGRRRHQIATLLERMGADPEVR